MYSSSNSPTHHIFFPPRLQVVAFQQDPDGFSPYPWYQLAFDHLFGQQAHRPARPSRRRLATSHRNDALSLFPIQRRSCPRPGGVIQCALQPALLIALADLPHRFGRKSQTGRRRWRGLSCIHLSQSQSSQHGPHRLKTAAQQLVQLLSIPPGKLNPECFASTHAIAIKPDTIHAKCISLLLIYTVVTLVRFQNWCRPASTGRAALQRRVRCGQAQAL